MWECVNVGVNEDGERDNEIKHKIVFGELLRCATRISLLRFDNATHPGLRPPLSETLYLHFGIILYFCSK